MSRTFFTSLLFVCLTLCVFQNNNGFAQNAPKKGLFINMTLLYPLLRPAEYGFGYKWHTKDNNLWSVSYRAAIDRSKTAPSDYKRFGMFSNMDYMNNIESMHQFGVRFGKAFTLFRKIQWTIEAGPSYNYYVEKIFYPNLHVEFETHEMIPNHHHMLGLSVNSTFLLKATKRVDVNLLLSGNLNSRFSYTAFGLQFDFKKRQK